MQRKITMTILGGLVFSGQAFAHGTMESPKARAYSCYLEGPESPKSQACQAAKAVAGVQALYDWNALSQLAGGDDRSFVPNGRLCGAGQDKYRGFDLPRNDWPTSQYQIGQTLDFIFLGTAPHATKRWSYYITRNNHDFSQALAWDDLEPLCEFGSIPLENGRYHMSCELPAHKTGKHIIYNVWERSDSTETFYTCMDVMLGDEASPAPIDPPPPVEPPAPSLPIPALSKVNKTSGNDTTELPLNTAMEKANIGDTLEFYWTGNNTGQASRVELYQNGMRLISNNLQAQQSSGKFSYQLKELGHFSYSIGLCNASQCATSSNAISIHIDTEDNSGVTPPPPVDPNPGLAAEALDTAASYQAGDEVSFAGQVYRCTIGPWCSQMKTRNTSWAYLPGEGLYWQEAWALVGEAVSVPTPPQPNADAFDPNASYQAGDIVSNAGKNYRCKIANWCSELEPRGSAWAYAPGSGIYWQQAWVLVP